MRKPPTGSFSTARYVWHVLSRCLWLLILLLPQAVSAQHITGDLQFRVLDSLEEPVPGVNALVVGPQVQGSRGGVSDELGYFHILALPPGRISVRISHAAFQPVIVEGVLVQLGKTTSLGEIRLSPRTHDMPELVISGQRPNIDPRSTTYGSNLRPADFENLPVDRDYKSMVSLLPQANTSYFGDAVNIGGATGLEDKYFVDGVEVTDPLIGGSGTSLPYNFIQEVQVKAGGYEADSRSALGGVLNVVTFSGTNEIHGSAFGFYTSNRFASDRRVGLSDPTQGGFSNYDVGFGIGGPIILDQLWFFVAYNPTFARRDVDVPGYGISVDRTTSHSFATKLTWSASERLRLILTATGDPSMQHAVGNGVGVPPSGLTNPDSYFKNIGYGGANFSLNGTYTFAQNLLIDGSVARVNRHDTGDHSTQLGSEQPLFVDHLDNVWSGGPQSRWDSFRYTTSARLAAGIVADAHSLKLGIEYKVNGTDNQYTVHTIDRYDSTYYVESVSRGYQTVHQNITSVFVQDRWQLARNVSIHAGVRWDGQSIVGSNGEVAQKIITPLQPRIGFTFLPDENGSDKIFGSFGRYAQEFALFQSVNLYSDQGSNYFIHFDHDPRISRSGGDTLPGSGPLTITPGVQGLRGQYYDEFSLGYERAVDGNLRVSLQGLYRTLREAIDDAFVLSEGRFRTGNPGRGILSDFPRPQRDYKALVLTIERREAEHFNFLASYVLSRDYGNYQGLFDALTHNGFPNQNAAGDNPSFAPINTTGLLPNDRTHAFKFSGSYRFAFGLVTGVTFAAVSGTPLSDYADTQIGIKFLAPRGSAGRTPALWDLSARIAYETPVMNLTRTRLVLDVFHIASQRKPVDVDQRHYFSLDENGIPFDPNSTYGQVYGYQPPMSVRLGMEVSF
jgi:hypothetical protein